MSHLSRGVAASVLLVLNAACFSSDKPRHAADAPETITIKVDQGTRLAFDLSPDGRSITFDLLGQLWEMPSTGGAAHPLTNAIRDVAEDLDPSYSPDGRRIVFQGERGGRTGLWLLEQGADVPEQLTQLGNPDGYDGNATWSPDGQAIAFVQLIPPDSTVRRWRNRLALLRLATGEVEELDGSRIQAFALRDPAWDPSGGRIAVVARSPTSELGGRVWIVNITDGRAIPVTREGTEASAPAFAPNGQRLAFFAPDDAQRVQVWVVDLYAPDAIPVRVTDHADVTPTRIRWTPDGTQVLYSADGRLYKVSPAGGSPSEIPLDVTLTFQRPRVALQPPHFPEPGVRQPVRAYMGLAISPDGQTVGMIALGKLWVMSVGGEPRVITDVPRSAHHLAWSADGNAVAWSAGPRDEEDLFETNLGTGVTRRLTVLPGREEYPAYAPDGQHLAYFHASGDRTALRVAAVHADASDTTNLRSFEAESGAELYWNPTGDALLYVTGGFSPNRPTHGELLWLNGQRQAVARMPDSPLFLHWTAHSITFVRHARLWRASFDSTGLRSPAEPLGTGPAMYASVSRDGAVLFVSEGGLRLRHADGKERTLGWPLSYTPPVADPLLIRNARVIDGTGSPTTTPQDILVERGKIVRMVDAGTIESRSATVLDAGGRHVIPGLIDLHAHEYRPEMLPGFLYFGVTTVRDQGSTIGPLIAHADAIASGTMEGPRVAYGGFQLYSDWAYDTEDGQGVEPEMDEDHAARAVALASAFGSQHVKVRTFRRWDINARFVTEAHRRGMRVTGHCVHPLPLIAAGMDSKEHGGFCNPRGDALLYDDFVQLFRAAGVAVVPTIAYSSFAVRISEDPGMLDGDLELAPFLPSPDNFNWMLRLDASGRKRFSRFAESARQSTVRLARGGVTIGTGTDIWQIPSGVHMELEELVAAGLTPLEAIRAASGDAARIMGAGAQFGTIEVGTFADLVILDADPTIDIRNTRRIWAVVQAGRPVDRAAIARDLQRRPF